MQNPFFSPLNSLTVSGVLRSFLCYTFVTGPGLKVPPPSPSQPLLVATRTSRISVFSVAPPMLPLIILNAISFLLRLGNVSLSVTPSTPHHGLCITRLAPGSFVVATSPSTRPRLHLHRFLLRGSLLQAPILRSTLSGTTPILFLMSPSSRTHRLYLWFLLFLLLLLILLKPLLLLPVYMQMKTPSSFAAPH